MKIAIFGASGFAREVCDIAIDLGYEKIVFIDETKGGNIDCFSVVSEKDIHTLTKYNYKFIIGIGSPKIRQEVWKRYQYLDYINLIHPNSTFGYRQLTKLREKVGNIVFPGARLTNNIQVGNFGIYYFNCTVTHDCIIEDFVTISPGANISGNVKLSKGVFIGTNACILQGKSISEKLVIGKDVIVGAGAVVTKNVPNHKIVKGVPAK